MTALAKLPSLSADLLVLIGSYGLARTDGVSEAERLHRWEQLIAGIKQYAADCVATLSPAELGGVGGKVMPHPLCEKYGCRDYGHGDGKTECEAFCCRLGATTPRADEAVIDDAMVERAMRAFAPTTHSYYPSGYCAGDREAMRAALTAALNGGGHGL